MATATTTLVPSNNTDALFRLWAKWISDTFLALGWVRSVEAGEIDLATVSTPAAINTSQGFQIWKMADALQATDPVYVKIEYGSGSNKLTPAIWLTMGQASDGAGTLTGNTTTRTQVAAYTYEATHAIAYTVNASGGTNRVGFAMWCTGAPATNASHQFWFVIERTHDIAGADTDVGAVIASGNFYSGTRYHQHLAMGGAAATASSQILAFVTPTGTGSDGVNTAVYPIFFCPASGGPFTNPFLGALVAFQSNVADGASIAIDYYDASHTYLVCGWATRVHFGFGSGLVASETVLLLRYE
jgi:hypothetical protein